MKTNKLFTQTLLFLILLFILAILLVKKMNSQINTIGQVFPFKELSILPNLPDNILVKAYNFRNSAIEYQKTTNFDRGDLVTFRLSEELASGSTLAKGDLIGTINSRLIDQEILDVQGSLDQEKATLAALSTGEKNSIIEEEKNQLMASETRFEDQQQIVERMRELKKSNLISDQELESAENYLKVLEIDVRTARSRLMVVSTGEKPETQNITRVNIQSLEKQLNLLTTQKAACSIFSPFDGRVNFIRDSLITLHDESSCYVLFPVRLARSDQISRGQEVTVKAPEIQKSASARIIRVNRQVVLLSGHQVFWVTAEIISGSIPAGTVVKCSLQCDSEPFFKRILKLFRYIEIN
ncbi:MAG: hypothetical protein JXQ65_04615 [Candidatus Marinimicrobia bacterium]|nr:hypothetical protein [Candidatus Neomarinimicrobiota bacterium]